MLADKRQKRFLLLSAGLAIYSSLLVFTFRFPIALQISSTLQFLPPNYPSDVNIPCNESCYTINSKHAIWNWHYFNTSSSSNSSTVPNTNTNTNSSKPTVLIAQFSGFKSAYKLLLETATPVHKAYASKWNYDFATATGVLMGCLDWHSAYNKIGIIYEAFNRQYDILLLMDSDAMIVDFDIPLTSMLQQPQTMITAQFAGRPDKPENLNNGVMVINLRHPKIHAVWERWYQKFQQVLPEQIKIATRNKKSINGNTDDQTLLHRALKAEIPNVEDRFIMIN